MDLLRFTKLSAVVALGDGSTFLFDLKQWAVGVFARGRTMSFDASFAGMSVSHRKGERKCNGVITMRISYLQRKPGNDCGQQICK